MARPDQFDILMKISLLLNRCESLPRVSFPFSEGTLYSSVHHAQAILYTIPGTVFPQTLDVFGVTIKSYNHAQVAYELSCPECHDPYVSPDVIDGRTPAKIASCTSGSCSPRQMTVARGRRRCIHIP
jgi:hypothetical protein